MLAPCWSYLVNRFVIATKTKSEFHNSFWEMGSETVQADNFDRFLPIIVSSTVSMQEKERQVH